MFLYQLALALFAWRNIQSMQVRSARRFVKIRMDARMS